MPFDALPSDTDTDIALFRESQECRERAVALWRTVPTEGFDINDWLSPCGTTACALGWLAMREVDGWRFTLPDNEGFRQPKRGQLAGLPAAANYFAISEHDAEWCFFAWNYEQDRVTASDVADRLLALPYTVAP